MTDILQEIALNKRMELASKYRYERYKESVSQCARDINRVPLSLSESIRAKNHAGIPGIIAEFKRRSPSKGEIAPCADVVETVKSYEEGGAAGCSVLTDTRFFGGTLIDLSLARENVSLPILRKDFIIDPLQITEAYLAGADLILLIAALLDKQTIKDFTRHAHDAGMEVLLEIHDENELEKVIPEADMIGVNNRALSTFHTDVNHSASLIDKLPSDALKIAESGITSREDITRLMEAGYNGFLIGETFMRACDPIAKLKEFTNAR